MHVALHPAIDVLKVSCLNGSGMEEWFHWLETRRRAVFGFDWSQQQSRDRQPSVTVVTAPIAQQILDSTVQKCRAAFLLLRPYEREVGEVGHARHRSRFCQTYAAEFIGQTLEAGRRHDASSRPPFTWFDRNTPYRTGNFWISGRRRASLCGCVFASSVQSRVRSRHVLCILYPQTGRRTHLRCLHGHSVLHQRRTAVAQSSQEGFGSWTGADHTGRTDFSLDRAMPGIVRTGAQRLSMTRKSQAR